MWFAYMLGFAAVLGTALMIFAVRRSGAKRDALQDYAEAQGWKFDYVAPTHGDPGSMAMSDPNDDWTLRVMTDGAGRRFEWSCPSGALEDGMAVLGPPLPPQAAKVMQSGGDIGKRVLKAAVQQTSAALGHTARDLTVDEASADHPGGVVMASPGKSQAMELLREAAELKMARVGTTEAQQPIIVRDSDGLKLRRAGTLRSLDDLSDLVALGTALRAYMPVKQQDWH